jgi:acetyltransferase-like isoleucine patch superfamily enzyme
MTLLDRIVRRLRGGDGLDLTPDERLALQSLARWVAREHIEAKRSPTIDPSAWISPLASLRFTERVEIGAKATIGPYCCIWGGWSRTWARVGAEALLSPSVVLVAGNHVTDGPGPVRDLGFEELDVEVGPGAWIGAHAVIVGRRVGESAVVAANSVVLDDVADYAIVAGSPARVIGMRTGIQ